MEMIIAFSFSLMPDGAPGTYNHAIACQLAERLDAGLSKSEQSLVALQWEIADALEDSFPALSRTLHDEARLIVVKPPAFLSTDIDQARFVAQLENVGSNNSRVLADSINLAQGENTQQKLNFLLTDARLYERFQHLELDNLIRPEHGDLLSEYRKLPEVLSHADGLRRYQRIRVNRLIIESIVKDKEVLKRGQYLSTGGVVEQVCEDCKRRGQVFQDVQVIAHPLHLPRCIKQSQQTFISQGLNVNVSEAGLFTIPPWDDTGAQVWCRSLSNWLQYEEIVLRLMSKSGS